MNAKEMTNLHWFCQSVEHGGFAAASLHNHVSAPTLSRAITQLEEKLGEKLLHRNAKQFLLTNAGSEYYSRFAPLFNQLNSQWLQLSNQQNELTGDIHVSCPEPFAEYFLQQVAIDFMQQHPNVNIHISFTSNTDRFIENQVDLAVTTIPTDSPHFVQRRLFNSPLSLAASPEYLRKHGEPTKIEQLLEHNLLAGNTMTYWEFEQQGQIIKIPLKPKYSVDSIQLTVQAACSGMGICLVPTATIASLINNKQLSTILPNVNCPAGMVYLIWADRKLLSTRVASFKKMILEQLDPSLHFLSSLNDKSVS